MREDNDGSARASARSFTGPFLYRCVPSFLRLRLITDITIHLIIGDHKVYL